METNFSYKNYSDLKQRDFWDKIKIIKKGEDDAMADFIKPGFKVLEFGAGYQKTILKKIKERNLDVKYFSYDIDRKTQQDFYNFEEINEKFDCIIAPRVFEHIEFNELIKVAKKCFELTDLVIFTAPNIFAPSWTFRKDFTHVTFLSPDGWRYIWLKEAGFSKFKVSRVASTKQIFIKGLISRLVCHDLVSMGMIIEIKK